MVNTLAAHTDKISDMIDTVYLTNDEGYDIKLVDLDFADGIALMDDDAKIATSPILSSLKSFAVMMQQSSDASVDFSNNQGGHGSNS